MCAARAWRAGPVTVCMPYPAKLSKAVADLARRPPRICDTASLLHMSPSVEAAWIAASSGLLGVIVGVTGTAIVGIAGFRNTRAATDQTLRAARGDRVWNRKADAYQDALTAALWRNHRRMYLTTADLTDDQYIRASAEVFERQTQQEWWEMQGRLGTFGAQDVVQAYNRSLKATEFAHRRHEEWRQARKDADGGAVGASQAQLG